MTHSIKKAAVIGSGTMGGGIAALLAGVGVQTMLLDIPAKGTQPGDAPAKRNAIVANNLKTLQKMRPAQLFSEADINNISIGNIDDDLDKLEDTDWIIEVVVERLDIKQNLMAKLAEIAKPEAIITTNTSGLPIHSIADGLGKDFTRRFMGTHFFNPPRYLKLLEVIPHPDTDPELVDFMVEFGTSVLGKGVVVAKDKPNFIGNRFMSMCGMQTMGYALDQGFTVEEVDALTGPLIGRPKTATFNLNDLVGFDIAVYVARNLYDAITDDPAREVLNHPAAAQLSQKMLDNNWLGRKSGQGFYHMRKGASGEKELWALNLQTMDYEPPKAVDFDIVKKHGRVKPLGERIRLLINEDDRAGQFLFHLHAFYLAYASNRVPEITDTIVNVDNAQKWGFSHEIGPFEIWDALGVEATIGRFEAAGYPVADWVKQMVAAGDKTFYQRDAAGRVVGYYSPQSSGYVPVERHPLEITVADLKAEGRELAGNAEASVYDMGDGVLLYEFHSKQNSIGAGLVEMGYKALELLEQPQYVALVVGNDAERFSIGANLAGAMAEGPEAIPQSISALQNLTNALRHASKPVVTAPFNMALGGGCELLMSGAKIVAHAELYTGLVEFGVGLVPAGGGCKELVRRLVNPVAASGSGDLLPPLQKVFENIALAKVSESAKQAMEMGFLAHDDVIVMNRAHLLGEAKRVALALASTYKQTAPEKVFAAGRDAYAALNVAIAGILEAGQASEYDAFIARKIARIITGGALAAPQWVDQQVFFELEKQGFIDLLMETKSQERIMYMLANNKPLRN